ncbi:MAG: electron transfer flavoprotein subunit alpha/FixB family protein [Thermoplasmatales archaeon]|nr:electron transfer flavoprotein subunit alpha/FixB family protein [Thermoplasmatales archaeon]MCW6170595.1 electron transfer flavoprotein subunit alpha/FixB family protein [Thermoplasmatales archaeon]
MVELVKATPPEDISQWKDVMVYCETFQNKLTRAAQEMIGRGRSMADKTKTKLIGVVIGSDISDTAKEAGYYGCDRVIAFQSSAFDMYKSRPFTDNLTAAVKEAKPNILIVPGTHNGRDLAARTAIRVQSGLTADCMEIDVEEETGILIARRPDYGDSTMSEIRCEKHRPQMATSRPGTFEVPPRDDKRKFKVDLREVKVKKGQIKEEILSFKPRSGEDISTAKIVVAGGLGMGKPEGLRLVEELANELGGVVGVSRPIADIGWISRSHQVGQTGITVRPNLYIAAGISGKPQHTVGMANSKLIVSINTDPDAEMNKNADYVIVDDLYNVIPALIEEIKKRKGAENIEVTQKKKKKA